METLALNQILDIAIDAARTDKPSVLSPSRRRLHVDARCLFVHLSRTFPEAGCSSTFRDIGELIGRKESDAAYLARRAHRLIRCQDSIHAQDFRLFIARAQSRVNPTPSSCGLSSEGRIETAQSRQKWRFDRIR